MSDETAWLDATDQAELVRSGQVSAAELVGAAIARIEELNPELNAVIHELFERATAQAAGPVPEGPFTGVPFLLKDLAAELEGTPYCEGMDFAGAYRSKVTQHLTQRFVDAGFVICGKTNTPELGILPTTEPRRFGASRNPWNTAHSTGGSSGGSAAAVASGMVPVAHANDGGGSIRIPASCCGLVGLKPTRARNSLAPQYGDHMGGLVVEHVVSRSVRDSAAVLDATAGAVPGDPYWAPPLRGPSFAAAAATAPSRLRLGLLTESPSGDAVHADCVTAARRAAALCESLGHAVEEVALDIDPTELVGDFVNVWAAGNAWAVGDWEQRVGRPATEADVEALTWALVELGRSLTAPQYLAAVQRMQRMARQVADAFDGFDAVVTPTMGEPPPPLGTFDSPPDNPLAGFVRAAPLATFTAPFNATGQPAISLPLHWNDGGLPVGVQFVGRFGDEETLLSLAGQLEAASPWAARRPVASA
jgi:amidase